jgi:hypothetical protein
MGVITEGRRIDPNNLRQDAIYTSVIENGWIIM